jgi:hypothetical protein
VGYVGVGPVMGRTTWGVQDRAGGHGAGDAGAGPVMGCTMWGRAMPGSGG